MKCCVFGNFVAEYPRSNCFRSEASLVTQQKVCTQYTQKSALVPPSLLQSADMMTLDPNS